MASKACSVCLNPWDREDHLPVALPACGHSFCRNCLVVMYRNDECIRCPTCRKVYKDIRPEDLPPNFALLDLVDSNVQDGPAPSPESSDVPLIGSPSEPPAPNPGSGVPPDEPGKRGPGKGLLYGCAAVVGGVTAVAAAPAVLTAVGFTSAGIAAGSWAASMMSIAAGLNGGGVAAGGLIATLQSVGAAGLGAAGVAGVGAVGGVAGAGVAAGAAKVVEGIAGDEKKDDEPRKGN